MNEDVKSIVAYRLKQARETLAAARALAKAGFLREAFEFRQNADYKLFVEPTDEQVHDMIAHAELFLREAERV